MVRPHRLGHVVIKVRDVAVSEKFYTEVVGLHVKNRIPQWGLVFFSANPDEHHELAILGIGKGAPAPSFGQVGLLHIAFRVKDDVELKKAYEQLKAKNVKINATVNHGVAKGVYFHDPDGNELEIYCDGDPDEYSSWPNTYAGTEKLPFAKTERGLADVAPIFGR